MSVDGCQRQKEKNNKTKPMTNSGDCLCSSWVSLCAVFESLRVSRSSKYDSYPHPSIPAIET